MDGNEIKTNQFKEEEPKQSPLKKLWINKPFRAMLGGSFLGGERVWKQLPFLTFLAILAMIYISNAYYAEKTLRQIDDMQLELKDLQNEFISSESALMKASKLSEVAKRLADSGLYEMTQPPKKIIIKSETSKP